MEQWPDTLRPQRGGRPIYVPRNTAGTVALSGFTQVVSSDAGTWKVVLEGIPLRGWPQIQTWDALALRLEGRLNPFLYRICEQSRQPFATGSGPFGDIPHSDDALFDDGSGYAQSAISAVANAGAALRATTLAIQVIQGGTIQPGHFFGVGIGRLYQVRNVLSTVDDVTTVRFLPPAREAITAGDDIVFERPTLKVRLATDEEMAQPRHRLDAPTVNLIEDPT